MRIVLFAFSFLLVLVPGAVTAQDKLPAKFGNVSAKDFDAKAYSVDTGTGAVVVSEVGSSRIEGNNKFWFSLVYKRYMRIHILDKKAFDVADVEIGLYSNDNNEEEKLDKLKAVTYNLEGSKVVETKLDIKKDLFKEKHDKNWAVRRFTFPNVKEGSIIELEYTIVSDFLHNLQPWVFQGNHARLWSEYNLELPEFLGYVFLWQGDKALDINERKDKIDFFSTVDANTAGASQRAGFNAGVSMYKWVKKNVKPLKEENFTSTLKNHIAKVEFQLTELRQPLRYQRVLGSWEKVAGDLLNAEYFGFSLSRDNDWLKDMVQPVTAGVTSPLQKAKNIYAYVRDHFTCTDYRRRTMDGTLRSVAKSRKGNVAEINLLLIAMLRYAGLQADPVILSTRSNGYAYSLYPVISQYNYVIVKSKPENDEYYLDASEPGLGFGKLPLRCYNGHARIINEAATPVELNSDSITESKLTNVFLVGDSTGRLVGSMQQTLGYYASWNIRGRLKSKGEEDMTGEIKKAFGGEATIEKLRVDSLNDPDQVVKLTCDFSIEGSGEDIFYCNPMFAEGVKENPFKSAERSYPVEMPYAYDETYTLQMEVPRGYVVDELPKSMVVKLNEQEDGLFEYRISHTSDIISLRSRIKMKRTYFLPDEYEMLREFFNLVVKKHGEQIVFKKKN